MKNKLILILVLVLAFGLRIYRLGHLEPFGDELDVGYHAYSIWQTGRDYRGQLLPTYIQSFSEWRAPLLMYVTAPFVGILGLSAWSVRLPVVLLGVLNVYLIYRLVTELADNKQLGLLSGFVLAVIPWHIHYSRTAFESTLLLGLVLAGTLFFYKEKFSLSALLFGLSFYTYNTANVFVPLLGLVLIFSKRKKIFSGLKGMILPGIILLVVGLPIVYQIFLGQAAGRFNLISIFGDDVTIRKIIHLRNTGINPEVERVFHNKLTGWGGNFVSNYLASFSTQFLFLNGDPNPRHSLPDYGQFYWLFAPFMMLGVLELFKNHSNQFKVLMTSWLLVSPIPSALTVGGGNQATRLFLMLPPLVILVSLGLNSVKKKLLLAPVYLLLFINLFFFFHYYFVHYQQETYRHWHYGYREAMTWLKKNRDNQRVIISNSLEPGLIRYLFWNEINPREFHQNFDNDQLNENILSDFNGFEINNTYFGLITMEDKINWLKENLNSNDLYLAYQGKEVPGDWDWELSSPEGLKIEKAVDDPWGNPLMYWVTSSD